MKRSLVVGFVALLCISGGAATMRADEKKSPKPTTPVVKMMFTGDTRSIDTGDKVRVFTYPHGSPEARALVYEIEVQGQEWDERLRTNIFKGRASPPTIVRTDMEMLDAVGKSEGKGVGYTSDNLRTEPGIHVIDVLR